MRLIVVNNVVILQEIKFLKKKYFSNLFNELTTGRDKQVLLFLYFNNVLTCFSAD